MWRSLLAAAVASGGDQRALIRVHPRRITNALERASAQVEDSHHRLSGGQVLPERNGGGSSDIFRGFSASDGV